MLRATKWKLEKAKVKVVFRLQFHATNIPQSGWDKLFVCFIPTESGKIIAKTSKASVRNGTCKWADPIYETTRLLVDSRNKQYDDKLYNLIVGMGSSHASILGEATINLADYADALNPFVIALPLHGSDHGTILHVTIQLLTAKTGFREFEQQFDRGLQSNSSYNREVEPSITTSSSELQISDVHENKVNTRTHFRSESKELTSIIEETGTHQDFSDSSVEDNGLCNNSDGYNADKHDSSEVHESRDLNVPVDSQNRSTEKTDYSKDNNLAIALEENHRLRGSLEKTESFVFELKQELNTLHNHANEMNMETQKIAQNLTDEISSGLKLEREIIMLRSECSKFKDEIQQLKEIKLRSQFMDRPQDQRPNGLFLVEGRIRELQKKLLIGFRESDLSSVNSDLEMLLGFVQNLEMGTGYDFGESQSLELLRQLNEAKSERGDLVKRMNEMECYYESLVQELEENRDRILVEFQKLRYEHLTCLNTISASKSETESIRICMKDQILKFDKERLALSCVNEELEKRVMVAEAFVQELEENREQILKEVENLTTEHSKCGDIISSCKLETESVRGDLKHQNLNFAKERQELDKIREQIFGEFQCLKDEHSTCVDTISGLKAETESLHHDMEDQTLKFAKEKQELEKNREKILGEFQCLEDEHSTCVDTISGLKAEMELLRRDMKDQTLKFAKETQELAKNRERILGEFQSLKTEHSTCDTTMLAYKAETESMLDNLKSQILKSTEELHALSCVNHGLETRVSELEENRERILRDFHTLKTEHLTCGNTVSSCKTETESIRVEMNNQILKLTEEKQALDCVNNELKKRVTSLESALERGRVNYSIAVTRLQNDLDMLSGQITSMFETNQKLIKHTFPQSSVPLSQQLSCEELYYENCYFNLYSVILEGKLLEAGRDYAQKLKTLAEKNGPEKSSESLRLAFMKEQCETVVQELKQQLFVSKRHGDDILIKLQDALDEIESRKKTEASNSRKVEELLVRNGDLEGELRSIRAELDCALINLECCKEEKQKIAAQLLELKAKKDERSILRMLSSGSCFQDLQRELMQLHKANEDLKGMYPRFKDITGDGNALGRVLALEIELAGSLLVKKKSKMHFQSSFLKQHSDEEAIFKSFQDINEVIKDTLEMKSMFVNMETELRELQERYSRLSLQFAEVEGERQKLLMTLKNVR